MTMKNIATATTPTAFSLQDEEQQEQQEQQQHQEQRRVAAPNVDEEVVISSAVSLGKDKHSDSQDETDDDFEFESVQVKSPFQQEKRSSQLSVISKRYDLENKGYLDENERMMREMDINNKGELDTKEVYKIVAEVRRQQHELRKGRKVILSMRRIIGGLVTFVAVLALSMLGASFTAAKFAKDVKVNHDIMSLTDKRSGETVVTIGSSKAGHVTSIPAESGSRRKMSERKKIGNVEEERTKRNASFSSFSPLGQLFRRKVDAKRRRRRHLLDTAAAAAKRRGLIPCNSRNCVPGSGDNGSNESDDNGEDGDLDTNRVDFGANDIDWDDECNNLEGTISRETFDDIVNRVFEGNDKQTTYILSFTDGDGLTYQYTMYISESYHYDGGDGAFEDEVVGIQTQVRLECDNEDGMNDIDSNCDAYQPVFIFEGCDGDGSTDECNVYTCAYRGVTYA